MSYIELGENDKKLFCKVNNIENIIPNIQLPLKFKVYSYIGENVIYECDLNSNMWASFQSYRNLKARLYTNTGVLLKEYIYRYENDNHHPDYNLDEFWDYYSKLNQDSVGLILGSGDGVWGEWVRGINENKVKCHLVEASKKTFERLNNNYKNFFYAKLHNLIISNDGADVTFYEVENNDGFNTTNIDFLIQNNLKSTKSEIRKIKNINEFLSELSHIDWMRIDIEGSDFDIITSIDVDYFKNLKMLQYEHLHLETEKIKIVDDIFITLGFKKIVFNIDTIYLKD